MKVGDLVFYKPEGATKGLVCLILNTLEGNDYYDALAPNGKVIFLSGRSLEVISEKR